MIKLNKEISKRIWIPTVFLLIFIIGLILFFSMGLQEYNGGEGPTATIGYFVLASFMLLIILPVAIVGIAIDVMVNLRGDSRKKKWLFVILFAIYILIFKWYFS